MFYIFEAHHPVIQSFFLISDGGLCISHSFVACLAQIEVKLKIKAFPSRTLSTKVLLDFQYFFDLVFIPKSYLMVSHSEQSLAENILPDYIVRLFVQEPTK